MSLVLIKCSVSRSVAIAVILAISMLKGLGQSSFYVSPSGNDANAGTSPGAAFQSLDRARQAVRGVNGTASADITVNLAGGLYHMTNTVTFSAADSGQNGFRIIYRAMPGQTPVLSGGILLSNWTLQDARMNIWKATVPAGKKFRQLYVNGNKANLARSADSLGLTQTAGGYASGNATLTGLSGSPSLTNVEVVIWPRPWNLCILPVAAITSAGAVTIQQPAWSLVNGTEIGANNPIWLQNAYEFMARPGDFYLQSASNLVYYIPRSGENLATAVVEAPVLEQLVNLAGTSGRPVSNLRFEGLSFQMTTWLLGGPGVGTASAQSNQPRPTPPTRWTVKAALDGSWIQNVDVSQCVFNNLGGDGVNLGDGSTNDVIDHCLFYNLSASAIQVSQGYNPLQTVSATDPSIVSGIVVANNTIHDIGTDYPMACGIFFGLTRYCSILHNHLYNLPYSGISLGWGWSTASPTYPTGNFLNGNLVHNHVAVPFQGCQLSDGGALYLNSLQQNGTVSENYAYGQGAATAELYFDDGGSDWSVFGNVTRQDGAEYWLAYKGSNNHIYGNYTDINNVFVATTGPLPSTCDTTTVCPGGNWPAAAQAVTNAAGPSAQVYYSSATNSILIGGALGNGGFSKGLNGWIVGGPGGSLAGVKYGAYADDNTPSGTNSIAFNWNNVTPGATLSAAFTAQAGHVYALSYSQATQGAANNQSLRVDILEINKITTLGASTTWASGLYSRYVRTFMAHISGPAKLQFTDVTTIANGTGSDCTLTRVELRDVTPPAWTQVSASANVQFKSANSAAASMSGAAVIGSVGDPWNQPAISGPGGSPAPTLLNFASGNPSAITLTCSNLYGLGGSSSAVSNAPALFTSGVVLSNGQTGTITLSGFNPGAVVSNLFIYSAAFQSTNGSQGVGGQGGIFTVGSMQLSAVDNGVIVPYTSGTNYVQFSNLVPDTNGSVLITCATPPGANCQIEGLQIQMVQNIYIPLSFGAQPINTTVPQGATGFFLAAANGGSGSYSCQWYQNGIPLFGQTQSTLAIPGVTTALNGFGYALVINDGWASITSAVATLSVVDVFQAPLNQLSVPAQAAYALRLLNTNNIGYVVQVRRDSDNATMNVGFGTNGWLDTAALLNFVGAGNGYVTVWYDQSGNGRHVTQGTAANQPQLVRSGVLNTVNGSPSLSFNGSQYLALGGQTWEIGSAYTYSVLCQTPSFNAGATFRAMLSFSTMGWLMFNGSSSTLDFGNWSDDSYYGVASDQALHVLTALKPASAGSSLYRDGVLVGGNGTPNNLISGSQTLYIGSANSGSWSFVGNLPEVLLFGSNLGAGDRQVLENNQGGAFGLSMNLAPVITAQPASQGVPPGANATFNVGVSSVSPPGFQWQFNGAAIPGVTGSSLTLSNVSSANAGNYTVTVTNAWGSVTSAPAMLTVGNVFTSTYQWGAQIASGNAFIYGSTINNSYSVLLTQNGIGNQHGSAVITGLNSGTSPASFTASFQVNLNGDANNHADGYSFNLTKLNGGQGLFDEVGAASGFAISVPTYNYGTHDVIYVKWNGATIATQSPVSTWQSWTTWNVSVDALGNFSVQFGANPALTGTIANWATTDRTDWQFVFAGRNGGSTETTEIGYTTITTVVALPLVVSVTPTNAVANAGASLTLTASASGGLGGYAYQWYQNGTNLNGQTASALVLNRVTADLNGSPFAVQVNDRSGNTNSAIIRLTVLPPPLLAAGLEQGQLVVRWPVTASGFTLYSSPALGAGTVWLPVTNPAPVPDPGNPALLKVMLPVAAGINTFFRLQ